MKLIQKLNKEKAEKRAAKMLAIKGLINHLYSSMLKSILVSKIPIISKKYGSLDMKAIEYLTIVISDKYKDDNEFLLKVGSTVYTDGTDKPVQISEEGCKKCSEYLQEIITDELVLELLENYDEKAYLSGKVIEGMRNKIEMETGKSFAIEEENK